MSPSWTRRGWGILSPLLAAASLSFASCSGGEREGTKAEGERCARTAECRTPLICCPEGRCSADLGCLEGGIIPYIDGTPGDSSP